MNKIVIICFLLLGISASGFAQGPTVSLPDPVNLKGKPNGGTSVDHVNLRTGEINFPITLASIPGRHGLGAQLVASYNSAGVRQSVNVRNLESSTGIMGLGWSLPMDGIFANHNTTTTREDDTFFLNGNKLVKISSSNSAIWEFTLLSYRPWKISYYVSSDTWRIIKEDGTEYRYGSTDNSRSKAIAFGNNLFQGKGSSNNQSEHTVGWYLNTKENIHGDYVKYNYEKVDKTVGTGSKFFTQSIYLKEIEGNLGHRIVLIYSDKDNSESQDPHQEVNENDYYQERYDTKYLSSVAVVDESEFMTYQLEDEHYEVRVGMGSEGSTEYPFSILTETCAYTEVNGRIQTDCPLISEVVLDYEALNESQLSRKRLLTGMTTYNDNGQIAPESTFEYHTSGDNKGVLNSQTSPTGAMTTYTFSEKIIDNSNREMDVSAPSGYSDPRVWHADNYTVITWYNASTNRLQVQCYEWDGAWYKVIDKLLDHDNVERTGGKQSFDVQLQSNYFALYIHSSDSNDEELLFIGYNSRSKKRTWISRERKVDVEGESEMVTSQKFVAVAPRTGGSIYVHTDVGSYWEASVVDRPDEDHYSLAAIKNTLASYNSTNGKIYTYKLDSRAEWVIGNTLETGITSQEEYLNLVSGSNFFTIQSGSDLEGGVIESGRVDSVTKKTHHDMWHYCEEFPERCSSGSDNELEIWRADRPWPFTRYIKRTRKFPYGWEHEDYFSMINSEPKELVGYTGIGLGPNGLGLKVKNYISQDPLWTIDFDEDGDHSDDLPDEFDKWMQELNEFEFDPIAFVTGNDNPPTHDNVWSIMEACAPFGRDIPVVLSSYTLYYTVYEYGPGKRLRYDVVSLEDNGDLRYDKNILKSVFADENLPDGEAQSFVISKDDNILIANSKDIKLFVRSPNDWVERDIDSFNGELDKVSIGKHRFAYKDSTNVLKYMSWSGSKWKENSHFGTAEKLKIGNGFVSLNNAVAFDDVTGNLSEFEELKSPSTNNNLFGFVTDAQVEHGGNFSCFHSNELTFGDEWNRYTGTKVQFYRNGEFYGDQELIYAGRSHHQPYDEDEENDISNLVGNYSIATYLYKYYDFQKEITAYKSMDEATGLKLHRAVNYGVTGNQSVQVVTQVTHHDGDDADGIDISHTAIVYKDGEMTKGGITATFDQVMVLPGTYEGVTSEPNLSSADEIVFNGSTDAAYRRAGLPQGYTQYVFKDKDELPLDGILHAIVRFDADMNNVSGDLYQHTIFEKNVGENDESIYFTRPTSITSMVDNLYSTVDKTYDDGTGVELTSSITYHDENTDEKEITTSMFYGHMLSELNDEYDLKDRNILNIPVATYKSSEGEVFDVKVSVFENLYGNPMVGETFIGSEVNAEQIPSKSNFTPGTALDYSSQAYNDPGSGYLKTSTITKRDIYGNVIESLDANGIHTSQLYGFVGSIPLATFSNAMIEEVYYEDFEDGSATDGWPGAMSENPEQTLNGTMVLGSAITSSFPQVNTVGEYIMELDVRFEEGSGYAQVGFQGNTSLYARLYADGTLNLIRSGNTVSSTMDIDPYAWNHIRMVRGYSNVQLYINGVRQLVLESDLGDETSPIVSGYNGEVEYDNIRIYPADATCVSKSVSQKDKQKKLVTDAAGFSAKTLYNDRNQAVAVIDGKGSVTQTHASSFRLTNAYDADKPDVSTTTAVLGAESFYDDFMIDKGWEIHDAGQGTTWDYVDGQLAISSPGNGTGNPDAFIMDIGKELNGQISIEFDITCNGSPEYHSFGFLAGGDSFNGYTPGGTENALSAQVYDLDLGVFKGSSWSSLGNVVPENYHRSYRVKVVISTTTQTIDYFLDGRLKDEGGFYVPSSGIQKFAFLNYGEGPSVEWFIDNLVVYTGGVQTSTWHDAQGKTIQTQSEVDLDHRMVTQIYHDEVGRATLQTKPVEHGGSLEYIPNFSSYNTSTKVMSGTVAALNPDCGDYPYSEVIYERSPLNRQVESRPYGSHFAPGTGRSLKTDSYTLEDAPTLDIYHLFTNYLNYSTADEYLVKSTTNADGNFTYSLVNSIGQVLFTAEQFADGWNYIITQYQYDLQGNLVKVFLPGAGITTKAYNGLGQVIEEYTTDGGTKRYHYDKLGRLRFMQDAQSAIDNLVLYWSYDALGRLIEEGTYESGWDTSLFDSKIETGMISSSINLSNTALSGTESYVADRITLGSTAGEPTLVTPGADITLTGNKITFLPGTQIKYGAKLTTISEGAQIDDKIHWKKRYEYQYHDEFTAAHLSLDRVMVNEDDDSDAEVEESFEYDQYARVVKKNQQVSAYSSEVIGIGYEYDQLGRVKAIDYGEGIEVAMSYDGLGRLAAIGSEVDENLYASYEYDDHGQLAAERLNNYGISTTYAYNELGWVTNIHGGNHEKNPKTYYDEQLQYTNGAYDSPTGYYGGNIASIYHDYENVPNAGDYSAQYRYDGVDRMTHEQISQYRINTVYETTYDENSNITSRNMPTQGDALKTYAYYAGTNQLQNWDGAGNDYTYDANGNTISNVKKSLTFGYDHFTNLASTYTSGSSSGQFHYGASNQRVLKTEGNKETLYAHGLNDYPLVEYHREADGTETKYVYVYGVTGLVASKQGSDGWKFLIKDHQGSIRVVFNDSNVAEEGHGYYAHGEKMFTASTDKSSYQYTGQERDAELDLYNYRARMYDEETGQFYAKDPAGQFHSPYSYVGGNPVNRIDPTGMVAGSLFAAIGDFLLNVGVQYGASVADNYFNQGMSWEESLSWENINIEVSTVVYTDWGYSSDIDNQYAQYESQMQYEMEYETFQNDPYMEFNTSVALDGMDIYAAYNILNDPLSMMACNGCLTQTNGGDGDANLAGFGTAAAGAALATGSKIYFDPSGGTWTGKNFKTYSTSWGGNGATGGKLKFAKKVSTGFKIGGYGLGAFNAVDINNQHSNGEISDFQMVTEQISNGVSTFGGIPGAAWGFGWEIGRAITNIPSYQEWKHETFLPWRKETLGY